MLSIMGNVLCDYCGRWTGFNVQIDDPPYICPYCGAEVHVSSEQIRSYREDE